MTELFKHKNIELDLECTRFLLPEKVKLFKKMGRFDCQLLTLQHVKLLMFLFKPDIFLGRSYGTTVDWMDSTSDESALWEKMINLPNTWVEDTIPLRMLMVAKLTK